MRLITAAIVALSPAIASAQCLTADALDTGISIEYGNGNTSHIQRTSDGTIMDAYYDGQSYYEETIHFETINGVFEKNRVVHENGSWEVQRSASMSYDFAPESVSDITSGGSGSGVLTLTQERYGDVDEAFGWTVYDSEPLNVGDCSYEAVRVFTTEFNKQRGEIYVREIKFLPELGFGIQMGNSYFSLSASNYTIASMTAD